MLVRRLVLISSIPHKKYILRDSIMLTIASKSITIGFIRKRFVVGNRRVGTMGVDTVKALKNKVLRILAQSLFSISSSELLTRFPSRDGLPLTMLQN